MGINQNALMKLNDEVIRVVHINHFSQIAYVVEMNSFKWPYIVTVGDLNRVKADYESELIEENAYIRFVLEEELTTSQQQKRDNGWEIVQFILSDLREEEIFIHKYRAPVLKRAEQIFKVGNKTLKKYLLSYWKGGATKNALLPYYSNCGGGGKDKRAGNNKRGRPRKFSEGEGINVEEHIKRLFRKGLNSYYYNARKNSLRIAYELTIKEYFSREIRDKNGGKILILNDQLPSYAQFLYWHRKNRDIKKEVSTCGSSKEYYQLNRPIVGSSTLDSGLAPGNLYQIDSTIADCYLISMLNRNVIVGRPVLYTVMDVYSRVIVGIHVTFESFNGYVGAMLALENAMTCKQKYCKKHGIEIRKEEWPYAVPLKILADRGELENSQIENAIANLGISIQNTPAYRADYKGIIESSFAQMNIKFKPFLDGVVTNSKNILERGEKDYRLKANLNLYEFTQVIIRAVLFHNSYHVLSEYVLDETQALGEVEKIPLKLWQHGLKNTKGQLRMLPEDTIRLNLLPSQQASITPKGVYFNKMYYIGPNLLKSTALSKARTTGNSKVVVFYDPRDLTLIYMRDQADGGFQELRLVEQFNKYEHMSIEDINCIMQHEEKVTEKNKQTELEAKIKLFQNIEQIVDVAKKEADKQKNTNQSKTVRLKGIKENLKQEKEIERKLATNRQESLENIKENSSLDMFKKL